MLCYFPKKLDPQKYYVFLLSSLFSAADLLNLYLPLSQKKKKKNQKARQQPIFSRVQCAHRKKQGSSKKGDVLRLCTLRTWRSFVPQRSSFLKHLDTNWTSWKEVLRGSFFAQSFLPPGCRVCGRDSPEKGWRFALDFLTQGPLLRYAGKAKL